MYNFIQSCQKAQTVPLPIVSKIVSGTMDLDNYILSLGVCTGLSAFFADYEGGDL
jgi:hypothetical protein